VHFHVIRYLADIFSSEKLWISPLCPHRRNTELYSNSVYFRDMSRQKRILREYNNMLKCQVSVRYKAWRKKTVHEYSHRNFEENARSDDVTEYVTLIVFNCFFFHVENLFYST